MSDHSIETVADIGRRRRSRRGRPHSRLLETIGRKLGNDIGIDLALSALH
ncbi:hypothetical protein [Rhodococcus jostii]